VRVLRPIGWDDVKVSGGLACRAGLSFDRLESDIYQPEHVLDPDTSGEWPGDWVGRAILGLTLIARATRRQPRYLDRIVAGLPERLNSMGYLGPVYPRGVMNEQQLSGHGWLLRGLAEYHLSTGDRAALDMLARMVDGLLVPTRGRYAAYPIEPAERRPSGGPAGNIVEGTVKGWYLSTDVGCAFIMLDGAVQAMELLDRPDLAALVEEMVERFLQVDLLAIQAQTHATLSALRGILRYYEACGRPELLDAVSRIYGLYRCEAMTENYANYNWFGRPEWTEPCAVVDSFMLAVGIWKHTGEPQYLEDAHHIYYNALCHEQRPNGGFGCDTCVGATSAFLEVSTYESPWCCTMRGAEGLARAVESALLSDGDQLYLPFYFDCEASLRFPDGACRVDLSTEYPYQGSVTLHVTKSCCKGEKTLKFFTPTWVADETVKCTRNGKALACGLDGRFIVVRTRLEAGDHVALQFETQLCSAPTFGANSLRGYHTFRHGPLVLGCDRRSEVHLSAEPDVVPLHKARYEVRGGEVVLSPLNDVVRMSEEAARASRKQVLFRS
jgi:hypothetical protein